MRARAGRGDTGRVRKINENTADDCSLLASPHPHCLTAVVANITSISDINIHNTQRRSNYKQAFKRFGRQAFHFQTERAFNKEKELAGAFSNI